MEVRFPEELIGNTPLVRLKGFENHFNLEFELYGKLEAANPLGSVKDRLALALVHDALEKGILSRDKKKNSRKIWVEPTSGNTGIGLAFLSRIYGFQLIVTMPESMSEERKLLLSYLGATVVLTKAEERLAGAVKAAEFIEKNLNAYRPGQFSNPANPLFHYKTTGPEIWRQLEGKVDVFIAGYGTGGTVSGAGQFLKEKNPKLLVITVEPAESPVLSSGTTGSHGIQGIGPGFVPETLNVNVLDRVATVSTEEAMKFSRAINLTDGLLVGISAGANACCAVKMKDELKGKRVVIILPDTGERYLSTKLFDTPEVRENILSFEEWRTKNGLTIA